MRIARLLLLLLVACTPELAAHAQAPRPADTLADLQAALVSCWEPPPGSEGARLSVRFALRRDGALVGPPWITHAHLPGDDVEDRAFVASVLAGLGACLPVAITGGLGEAIAGRPFTLTFEAGRRPPA